MKKVEQTEGATSLMKYKEEFETVCSIIATHRKRVIRVVNNESMSMVWEVGGYVSHKLKTSVWGDGVVRQLSDYIRTKYPAARGWSYRTLYKMVQLYDTYTTASFSALIEKTDMTKYGDIVPFETAQIDGKLIVPFEMAQIPNVLFATGWTNHQIILNRCKSDTERLFYMLYAGKEHLENKELLRTIKTDTINSLLGGKDVQSEVMTKTYPTSPLLFKDKVYLEMLGLPLEYKESKLRKEIIAHMKDFILEMGKDFLFIDDEHRVTVGSKTFKVDLLFYHRLLQCMIAIELKTTEFHPKDLGQLEFYLEALDQEERRSNENPSIGIILCKEADMEVVRYALNRSMSPTMVALYKEQLQVGSVIQRSLVEFCKFLKRK
jgi:predicted nuclease of restriction endonuclease-like (RecB) superfamily